MQEIESKFEKCVKGAKRYKIMKQLALRLLKKSVSLLGGLAVLIALVFGGYNGAKAASGTVDLIAVGTGHANMYYIGMPGNGSCSSVRIPVLDTLSTTATFTARPNTMITLIQNNWGNYWKVVNGAVVASNGVTVTGLNADFTASGTVTVTLPAGMSRDVKVCYKNLSVNAGKYNAYGLGAAPAANVVKLPFKDGPVYNHTVQLTKKEHQYEGGFVAYKVDPTATAVTFTMYDLTSVKAFVFGKDIKVAMDISCTGTVCTASFPEGTTRADWSAPQFFYDWDGTGTEPALTGVDVTATNAMP